MREGWVPAEPRLTGDGSPYPRFASTFDGRGADAAFAVLHVADFPLQAILRTAPDLAERPVALIDGERKRATVIALTPAAHAQGVEHGLTTPQALARCPTLLLRPPQPAAEAEGHAALLAAAFTLSPLIEATAPGVATADVTALPVEQRQPALHAALAQLAALGLPATGGLAATPLLALYAARTPAAPPRSHSQPGIAPSLAVVTDPRAFLDPLPLAVAGPPPDLAPILASWGLRTLGDLTALSKADIVQRLGPAGLALWERAAGETTRPLHPVTPPRRFEAALDLEHPVETLEPLLFLLRRFIDRLALELRAAGLVAAELRLELILDGSPDSPAAPERLERGRANRAGEPGSKAGSAGTPRPASTSQGPASDDTVYAREFRLPEPTAEPNLLFRTLHSHLETVQAAAAIVAVRLAIEPARPLARQHGLFDTGLRDPHGFAETLARTVAVVGSGRVGTPHCDDTHRPDAVTLTPPAAVVPPPAPPAVPPPGGLPLRRFRPPRPAKVEIRAGSPAPAYVWTDTLRGEVGAVRGPWRGSGDWWQPDAAWEREEWDVALAGGGLYRVVRTPEGWWLEGEYD